MCSANFSSARTSSRRVQIRRMKSRCVTSNAARLTLSPVSSSVPSGRMIRAERRTLSLLAWVPQFMPEALFMTIPPTMALLTEAGSGANFRPKGANSSFTRCPIIPGCRVISLWSGDILYFSQCLPATMSMESLMACPDRLVPAARKVTGRLYKSASFSNREISSSPSERITICGMRR